MLRNLRDFGFAKSCLEGIIHDSMADLLLELKLRSSQKSSVNVPEIFSLPIARSIWYFFAGTTMDKEETDKLKKFVNKAFQFQRTGNPTGAILNIIPWIRYFFPGMSGHTKQDEANKHFHQFIQVSFFLYNIFTYILEV